MPHPRGWTPHTCFHLYLFWSHYRTYSLSHVLGAVAVGAAPLTSYQGHLQWGQRLLPSCMHSLSVHRSQFLAAPVLVCEPRGTLPEAGDAKPGRVGHMSIPEPQTRWPAGQSLQPLDVVFGDSVDFITGVPHFSPRHTGHSAHPTPDIPGGKVPMMGAGLCRGNMHTP